MPNRIIREHILTSTAVCSLGWAEEVFYRRLMSVVDDYGRCEALPQLLRSRCYPLQTDLVRVADITRWMAACRTAGLIAHYEVAGKWYLEIAKFGQQQRSASKHPAPPSPDSGCNQLLADAHLDVFVSVVEGVVDKPAAPAGAGFDDFWNAYPKKKAKGDALKAFAKRKPDAALLARMLGAIETQKRSEDWTKDGGKWIPYPATWLNDARWEDEADVALSAAPPVAAVRAIDETQRLLAAQAEHAAKATPMPESLKKFLPKKEAA